MDEKKDNDYSEFFEEFNPPEEKIEDKSVFEQDLPPLPELPTVEKKINETGSDFEWTEELETSGKAAMGEVLIGAKQGKKYIVKRIRKEFRDDLTYQKLFFREYENAKDLDHLHIVRIHHKGADVDGPYYYMDYVDGRPLTEVVGENGTKDLKLVDKVMTELLGALDYVHKKQIYHRDLKPDNILLTWKGDNVKLIDFGLASADQFDDKLSKAGTLKYAAPEQLENAKSADHRSDIYAVGKILLELLTGQTEELYHLDGEALRYAKIIKDCTRESPIERFQSAQEVLDAIRKVNGTVPEEDNPQLQQMKQEIETLKQDLLRQKEQRRNQPPQRQFQQQAHPGMAATTDRSRIAAAFLSFFFGGWGGQFFYTNRIPRGVMCLILGLTPLWFIFAMIGVFYFIRFMTMTDEDFAHYVNKRSPKQRNNR